MNKPLVSVVMATFNESPEQITQSIQSILAQTMQNFELLLIDDSTKAETVDTIDSLAQKDARIKVIRSSSRIGFVPALNIGLKQAQGEYIARMDGDDVSLPNRFELQTSYLNSNPNITVVGGAIDIINGKGDITSHRDYAATTKKVKLFSLMRNPIAHPTAMIRKNIVGQGFLYDETFLKAEDLELWLRLMKNGYKIVNVRDTILLFRVQGSLADKRVGDNFRYNYKARKKNFSWRSPFWSLTSLLISKAYTLLPKKIVSAVYKVENKNE